MSDWLLTSTTYGTWLPGDQRGSVTSVRERRVGEADSAARREHDRHAEPYEAAMPGLRVAAAAAMKGPRVLLSAEQAGVLLSQFQETATHRGCRLLAAAIMTNHFHLVVSSVPGVDAGKLLGAFKSYGSRRLNRQFGQPGSKTWWTARGSKRLLPSDSAVASAINYVLHKQPNPLAVWAPDPTR